MEQQRVMEGAEPFRFEGEGEIGVLVSHGFTGTTQSIRPLGEALAAEGFTVAGALHQNSGVGTEGGSSALNEPPHLVVACNFCARPVAGPRLSGHGTSLEDHARSTASGWISSIEEDLAWLETHTSNIFFAGLSMGGMFALYFAAVRPALIRGVIPINACVFLNDPDLARLVFNDDAPPTVPGVGSDIQAEGVEELVYPEVPVPPLKEFMALMRVTDDLLPEITAPTLIFQSTEDHVVPPENGPHILEKLGTDAKELIWLDNSYHVATLDNDADLIAERAVRFIRERAG